LTHIDNKLRQLEHSNKSPFRISRWLGGGLRRFWRNRKYHSIFNYTKQNVERAAITR